ncbi:hypothetical protein QE152_g25196 [Popillia japonica]|uniref:Uncharacterized protein n=1 Tax=Popillia japonica TaxID=7064 RepID=A0AAW1K2R1_POPJA
MKILSAILFVSVALGLFFSLARAQADDCSAIGEIRDVVVQINGAQLMVLWQEPTNTLSCSFSNLMHNVTYEGYTDTQEVITSSYFV